MIQFVEDYPEVAITLISLFFTGIGFLLKTYLQQYYNKIQENRELKIFLWKEKIESAKKASEFYYEQMNYLNLRIRQFECYASDKDLDPLLIKSIEDEVTFYGNKLKNNTDFQHHHINIFFKLDDPKMYIILDEAYDILKELPNVVPLEEDSEKTIEIKIIEARKHSSRLKELDSEILERYKIMAEKVRNNIAKFSN